ncbi:MAG: DUF1003 domain-containing protein [Candidatus Chisholmbacteria bacterium]|nr:DUF1003 domain-containing protein [Candidatus Chisholmbacteria bacterium]
MLNMGFFVGWIVVNSGWIPGFAQPDPFPFVLLTTMVSLEAIVLTVIVLVSQNRQSYISALREELDLQVNLLAEREVTKVLKLLIELHRHLGTDSIEDRELASMLKETDPSYIVRTLETQMQSEKPRTLPQVVAARLVKGKARHG